MTNERYAKNYINGLLVPALSGAYLDNLNPATGKVYSQLANSGVEDAANAIAAAEAAFPDWQKTDSERRFRILMRIADIIEQNALTYARAESIDTGKPLAMSSSQDIPGAQAYFRYYASFLFHRKNELRQQEGRALHYHLRQPLGVVACILSPQLPLYSLCRKVAPALAMGNTVVVKVSQYTPMTAALLARDLEHAGLPKGVLNIIQGKDDLLINYLTEHPSMRAIAYTGMAEMGKQLLRNGARQTKKLTINIGGNNPTIVFGDCDFDQMMIGTLRSSFSNNGQLKHHASRILVQRDLYPKLKEELVKRAQFIKIGNPFATITDLGALLSEAHLNKVEKWITLAELEGGQILCGGKRLALEGELEGGYFIRPAVIDNVANTSALNQEELFGPMVTLQIFDTEEEAIALANATQYGLSASVWTQDIQRAHRLVEAVEARTIWVNTWLTDTKNMTTGGIFHTGLSGEGGQASLDFFSEGKEVCMWY